MAIPNDVSVLARQSFNKQTSSAIVNNVRTVVWNLGCEQGIKDRGPLYTIVYCLENALGHITAETLF